MGFSSSLMTCLLAVNWMLLFQATFLGFYVRFENDNQNALKLYKALGGPKSIFAHSNLDCIIMEDIFVSFLIIIFALVSIYTIVKLYESQSQSGNTDNYNPNPNPSPSIRLRELFQVFMAGVVIALFACGGLIMISAGDLDTFFVNTKAFPMYKISNPHSLKDERNRAEPLSKLKNEDFFEARHPYHKYNLKIANGFLCFISALFSTGLLLIPKLSLPPRPTRAQAELYWSQQQQMQQQQMQQQQMNPGGSGPPQTQSHSTIASPTATSPSAV